MPLIDQRILIDAPPEVVWQVIADQSQLPNWHAGCRTVSVLTTQQQGVGVRRRCTLENGKDVIEEITTWLDGMGYEYRRVEGGPYRAYEGRLRLQLGPDGTSVQWTVTYQPKGLLGMLRDRLSGHRALAQMVSTSLRQLRRAVDALGQRMDADARARATIRERLNADERAQYERRFAPTTPLPGTVEAVPEPGAEPVPAEPRRPVSSAEPSFVGELTAEEPPVDPLADTQPKTPQELQEEAEATPTETPEAAQAFGAPPDAPPGVSPTAPEPAAPAPVDMVNMEDTEDIEDQASLPLHQRITPARGIPSVQPSDASSTVVERPTPRAASETTETTEMPRVELPHAQAPALEPEPPEAPARSEATDAPTESEAPQTPDIPDVPPPSAIKPPAVEPPAVEPEIPPPPAQALQPPAPPPAQDPHAAFRRPAGGTRPLAEPSPQEAEPTSAPEPREETAAPTKPLARPEPPASPEPIVISEPEPRPNLPPQTPKTDTGEISIWEVFGMRRPSEEDSDVLDNLIQSIQARHQAELRLMGHVAKRPPRVRFRQTTVGLRIRLALLHTRVRLVTRFAMRGREG